MHITDRIQTLYIDVPCGCNLNCPLCSKQFNSHIYSNSKNISYNDIINKIIMFKNIERIVIGWNNSEPTLYDKLFDLIDFLHAAKIKITINTNGNTQTSDWWINFGKKMNFEGDKVIFSIAGTSQALHERYRINSNLHQLLENHKNFMTYNYYKNDYVQYIIFSYNEQDFLKNASTIRKTFSNFIAVDTVPLNELYDISTPEFNLRSKYHAKYLMCFKYSKYISENDNVSIDCDANQKELFIDKCGNFSFCPNTYFFHGIHTSNILKLHELFEQTCNINFNCCKICIKSIKKMIDLFKMNHI